MTDLDGYEDEAGRESGSSLRRKLEETLTRERQLDKMSTKAEELQQERAGQQADLARDMLAKRGLQGVELDRAVEDFLAPGSGSGDAAAHTRAKEMSTVGGSSAPLRDASGLLGLDAIDHALRTGQ